MTNETFKQGVNNIITTSQIESPNKLTLEQYYNRFKGVSDQDWLKMCDWVLDNVEIRWKFPIIFDFVRARRAIVKPVTEYTAPKRDENVQSYGAYTQEIVAKFKIMDRIRSLYLRDKKNPITGKMYGKNFKDRTTHSCQLMKKLYTSAVKKGKVFDIDSEIWVDVYDGGNTFNPKDMGF